jgi:single-stranded-DNA-specific exonuclease
MNIRLALSDWWLAVDRRILPPGSGDQTGQKTCQGSCRSISEFDIISAIDSLADYLIRYGGHPQAAGFSLKTSNLATFLQALARITDDNIGHLDLQPILEIDAEVSLNELGGDTFQSFTELAPFGRGNPVPVLMSRAVEVLSCRQMVNNGKHLRLRLRNAGAIWDAVAFGQGECLPGIKGRLDIAFTLEKDEWMGETRLRLKLLDIKIPG